MPRLRRHHDGIKVRLGITPPFSAFLARILGTGGGERLAAGRTH